MGPRWLSTLAAISIAVFIAAAPAANAHNLKCIQAHVDNTIYVCPDITVPAGEDAAAFCAKQASCGAYIFEGRCVVGAKTDRCESPVAVDVPGVNFYPYRAAPSGDRCIRDRTAQPTIATVTFPNGCK